MNGAYLFIEAIDFTRTIKTYFGNDEAYADLQQELAKHPEKGSVIAGATP